MGRFEKRSVPRANFKRFQKKKKSKFLFKEGDKIINSRSRKHDFKIWKEKKEEYIKLIADDIINSFTRHVF